MAPNIEHIQLQDKDQPIKDSEEDASFNPGDSKQYREYDLTEDVGINPGTDLVQLVQHTISDSDYRALMRTLNKEQKEFFCHVLHWIKINEVPLYYFLAGGAGVAKSWVIKAVYQALVRYLNAFPGDNPDDIKVLKVTLTGKAAFIIHRNTIHSELGFQPNFLCQLSKLKVLIIDEVSMIGNNFFKQIHRQLQIIMGSNKPFGGVSVITVGDMFQLLPAQDGYIFEALEKEYGALATNLWKAHFSMYELNTIIRQKNKDFAELLNRMRENCHTNNDIELLKMRLISRDQIQNNSYEQFSFLHLFFRNKDIDLHKQIIYDNRLLRKKQ